MDNYSTREAAQKLGISWGTLNKFIGLKQIPMPPVTRVGGVRVRLWSEADIVKLRKLLPKIANGRKTRYKKKELTPAAGRGRLNNSQSRQARDRSAKAKTKTRSKSKSRKKT